MHGIERHFRTSELSQDSALAASSLTAATATEPTVRYYPNLGVAFGTVDRAGLAALARRPGRRVGPGRAQAEPHRARNGSPTPS